MNTKPFKVQAPIFNREKKKDVFCSDVVLQIQRPDLKRVNLIMVFPTPYTCNTIYL